jgi:hypothetical protein
MFREPLSINNYLDTSYGGRVPSAQITYRSKITGRIFSKFRYGIDLRDYEIVNGKIVSKESK